MKNPYEIKEVNGFKIRMTEFGPSLIIDPNHVMESKEFMVKNNIKGLEINVSVNFDTNDLSFLEHFDFITHLNIIHYRIDDMSPLYHLKNLLSLAVQGHYTSPIDFSRFPKLIHCFLEWTKGADSIFECVTLKKLYINSYKGKNADKFTKLINLESLKIGNSPIENIEGLRSLGKLRELGLYYLRKLQSLKGIEELTNLEVLDLYTCRKISSLKEIENLKNLRKLLFNNMGEIESIKVLENLPNLEWVLFYESTNILDGDLTPLTKLPKLSRLAFQNRRHYTHKCEDFPACQR